MKVKIYFSKSLINDTPYDIFTVFAVHNLNVFQKKKGFNVDEDLRSTNAHHLVEMEHKNPRTMISHAKLNRGNFVFLP